MCVERWFGFWAWQDVFVPIKQVWKIYFWIEEIEKGKSEHERWVQDGEKKPREPFGKPPN